MATVFFFQASALEVPFAFHVPELVKDLFVCLRPS